MVSRAILAGVLPAAAAAGVLAMATPALAAPELTVSPSTGLTNGQTITLTGSGYKPGSSVFGLQCSGSTPSREACDTSAVKTITVGADGSFTESFTVKTGKIGNGTCDAGDTCVMAVSDPSGVGDNTPIVFAAAASASAAEAPAATAPEASTPEADAETTTETAEGSTTVTSVNAGSGGQADQDGVPAAVLGLSALGVALLAAAPASLRLRSRRTDA
jgi:hypothetical protein